MKWLVIYDLARVRERGKLEALLAREGFVRLFKNVMHGELDDEARSRIRRRIRARLRGSAYRVALLPIGRRALDSVVWLHSRSREEVSHGAVPGRLVFERDPRPGRSGRGREVPP